MELIDLKHVATSQDGIRCTTSGVHEVTLHEKFSEKKPNLSHVRIFSSITYMHIPNEKRQKLGPKSEKCIRVGYSLELKGDMCISPLLVRFM